VTDKIARRVDTRTYSLADVVNEVEQLFDCQDGEYGPSHRLFGDTVPNGPAYPYIALGLIATNSTPDAQEYLRLAMLASFRMLHKTCKSTRPVLYWRFAKEVRIQEETEKGGQKYKIRTRIAIPEADYYVVGWAVKLEAEPYKVVP
jgi:hypothetical protein